MQNEIAEMVISEIIPKKEIINICIVDVTYRNNIEYYSAVLMTTID
ncbi:MAG TPA: hypothetical protein VFI73_08440 [Candidatus Nitrosopolaris sp.]|nr:hypothetical protein [Candidatus Nitrosopolaris sp.]